MKMDEYQGQAWSYALPQAKDLQYLTSGLSEEVGEVNGLIAKAVRDGAKEDFHKMMAKELGDVLWFVAGLCSYYQFYLDDIARMNIHKLADRKLRNKIQGSGDER